MIECKKLTRRFGRTLALDGIDLHVAPGELHGFIGPNGAGKTTAMRILATLTKPTRGEALVDGVSVTKYPQRARMLVGYMPDFFGVYDNLKAWEYLDLYAGCVGLSASERRKRIDALLALTALTDKREAYVDHLSRGMKQRLCLARAMLHDPKLLILDEPASGMDPHARAQMRDILRDVAGMGKTVLISSHILPELSELCDSMTILERGNVVFTGSAEEIGRKLSGESRLIVRFVEPPRDEQAQRVKELLINACNTEVQVGEDGIWRVTGRGTDVRDAELLTQIMALDVRVSAFYRERATLESVFMEVTQGETQSNS